MLYVVTVIMRRDAVVDGEPVAQNKVETVLSITDNDKRALGEAVEAAFEAHPPEDGYVMVLHDVYEADRDTLEEALATYPRREGVQPEEVERAFVEMYEVGVKDAYDAPPLTRARWNALHDRIVQERKWREEDMHKSPGPVDPGNP